MCIFILWFSVNLQFKIGNISLTLFVVAQTAKTNRPTKRQGGGGFGYFKSMNDERAKRAKQDDKTRIYRQPKPKYSGKRDARQFSR